MNYDFYKNLTNIEEILRNKLNVKFNIEGFLRKEVWEIPQVVLREIILNAMGHRDYNSTGVVQIEIHKNRIEVYNPGGLIEGLKKEDLGKFGSRPRNPFLFSILDKMNLVDNVGSGIRRVIKTLKERNLEYECDTKDNYFKFTIYRRRNNLNTKTLRKEENDPINDPINRKREEVLNVIRKNPGLRKTQIRKMISITEISLKRTIKDLKDENVIEFRGSKKTGGYYLK